MTPRKAATFFILLISLEAQSQKTQGNSMVPVQLRTDQTVFLANGGAPVLGANALKGSDMLYVSMYKALESVPRFKMVATPNDATMTFVVTLRSSAGPDVSALLPLVELEMYDVKTHALLWVLEDPASSAIGTKQFQRAIDTSMQRILAELASLASGQLP